MVKTTKKVTGKKHKAALYPKELSRAPFSAFCLLLYPFCFLVPLQNAKI